MTQDGTKNLDAADLFRRHGPAVYRRARRLLGTHHDAEEATQEVFIRVLKSAEAFEGRSSVTTWLYEVTTNYCLNALRDRQSRGRLWTANVSASGSQARSAPSDELAELRELLAAADEQQARAAIYVYLDGMSHDEAAETLAVSRRTVGNLLERFRAWAIARSEEQVVCATDERARKNEPASTCPNVVPAGPKHVDGHGD